MTPTANIVVPLVRRRVCSGEGDFNGSRLCIGPLVIIGEGLGNQPLVNRSAGVCKRCWRTGRSNVGDIDRRGDGGSFFIGVIFGNGYALDSTPPPPADDAEVVLPQLELRLPPPFQLPSSTPRTVKSRVNNSALAA